MTTLQSNAPSSDAALLRRPTAVRLSWLVAGLLVLAVLFLLSLAFGTESSRSTRSSPRSGAP